LPTWWCTASRPGCSARSHRAHGCRTAVGEVSCTSAGKCTGTCSNCKSIVIQRSGIGTLLRACACTRARNHWRISPGIALTRITLQVPMVHFVAARVAPHSVVSADLSVGICAVVPTRHCANPKCRAEITACMGHVLACDMVKAMTGTIKWKQVREICGPRFERCETQSKERALIGQSAIYRMK
jgi:hypothetical protein